MLRLLVRTTDVPAPMAYSAQRSQMTLQTPRSFNAWLRGQLKEKKMSQRQLALQSGVDHSTISRLIKGDRMPSLGTATKLARGLREIHDEADGPAYFASLNSRAVLPTTRVEYALRGDDSLTEADVRELMQAYIAVRARRTRADGNGSAPGRTGTPTAADPGSRRHDRVDRRFVRNAFGGSAGSSSAPLHSSHARRRLTASQPSSAPGVSMMNVVPQPRIAQQRAQPDRTDPARADVLVPIGA